MSLLKKLAFSFNLIIVFTIVPVFALLGTTNVSAQAYRGLIIDQFRYDLEDVNPGDVIKKSFKVTYDFQPLDDGTYKSISVNLISKDFKQNDIDGKRIFIEKDELPTNARMSDWISFEESSITLDKPGQTADINFTITVPNDAQPGGVYGAVLLQNNSGDAAALELANSENFGFGINSSLGPLIFMTVNGDIKKELVVEKIFTTNIKGSEKSFFFQTPVNLVVRLKNTGNVHLSPYGKVYFHKDTNFITNSLQSSDLNKDGLVILPGTTRDFIFTWDPEAFIRSIREEKIDETSGQTVLKYSTKVDFNNITKLQLGNHKATIQFTYEGSDGTITQTQSFSKTFLVLPIHLIILAIFILLIILLFIIVKKLRKHG